MELPSTELINDQRIAKFKQLITDTLATKELGIYYQMIEQFQKEHKVPAIEVAAALALLLQGDAPFMLQTKSNLSKKDENFLKNDAKNFEKLGREQRRGRGKGRARATRKELPVEKGMECFRLEVGHNHSVKIKNIVGAIANESGLDSQYIGRVNIYDDYSEIDLPEGMPKDVFKDLKKVWVSGQQLNISAIKKDQKSRFSATNSKDKHTIIRKKIRKKTKQRSVFR